MTIDAFGPRGRGRPKKSTPLAPIALEHDLREGPGRLEALVALAKRGLAVERSRDQMANDAEVRKTVETIAALQAPTELLERMADLQAQLEQLQAAVAGKKGSALRADAAVVPPSLTEVEAELRDDMAPTPAPPRGGGSLQS